MKQIITYKKMNETKLNYFIENKVNCLNLENCINIIIFYELIIINIMLNINIVE